MAAQNVHELISWHKDNSLSLKAKLL
jgi:hypothetical protein